MESELPKQKTGGGLRFNSGKIRMGLLPNYAIEQLGQVMTKGAEKYTPHNWEYGMPWSTVLDSMKRHISAFERGEDYDPESGLLHTAHVMANAGFITEYYKIYPQGDDRFLGYLHNLKVGLDIDDVLADFCIAFCERYKLPIPTAWNFDGDIASKFKELSKDKEFWTSIPVKTDPLTMPFEPACYITSRSIPKEWTQEWLNNKGFPTVPLYQVGIDGSKVEVAKKACIDVFVDDRFDNFVELTNAGVFTFLFTAPHNVRYDVGHRRINSLTDLFKGVKCM